MKKLLLAGVAALALATGANASTIGPGGSAEGITYAFSVIGGSLNSTSATFDVHITGINVTGTDLEGGRSGINAIAFSTPGLPAILSGTSSVAGLQSVGLNSGGCSNGGGFFCFGNANPPTTPPLTAGVPLDVTFTLNLVAGNFLGWTPAFKIDWVGSQNNYNLVSQDIPIGPNGTPFDVNPVPIPAVGTGLPGIFAFVLWMLNRNRKKREALHLPAAA